MCEVCGEAIVPGDMSRWPIMGMSILDKPCFNAARAMHRGLADHASVRKRLDVMRVTDPRKFKSLVLSFRVSERFKRARAQIKEMPKLMQVLVEEESTIRRERELLMTKAHHIAWHRLHEGLGEEDALKKWKSHKLDVDRHTEKNKQGELAIAAQLPTELISDKARRSLDTQKRQVAPASACGATNSRTWPELGVPREHVRKRSAAVSISELASDVATSEEEVAVAMKPAALCHFSVGQVRRLTLASSILQVAVKQPANTPPERNSPQASPTCHGGGGGNRQRHAWG